MKVSHRNDTDHHKAPPMFPVSTSSEMASSHTFLSGNESAYAQLYEQYFPELYNYGVKLCGQPDFAKDCIHDLFIDLWKQRKKRVQVTAVKSYLFKALRNIIMKAQKRQTRFRSVDLAYCFELEPSSEAVMIGQQTDQTQQQRLHEALETLTQRQREAVFLKFYSQLAYDEVASVLGISTKATYKLTARAIDLLRKKMIPIVWLGTSLSAVLSL